MRAGPRRVPRDARRRRRAAWAQGLRDVALLRLLHDLGLRRSEAVRLDIEDVGLPGKRISLLSRGRSWKEPVALPEPTQAALAAWLEARGSNPARCLSISTGPARAASDRHRGLPHRRPARRQGRSHGPAAGAAPSRDHHGTRADRWRRAGCRRIFPPPGPAPPRPLPLQPIWPCRQGLTPCR